MVSIMIIIIGEFWPSDSQGYYFLYSPTLLLDGFYLIDDFANVCVLKSPSSQASQKRPLPQIFILLVIDGLLYLGIYNYFVGIFPGKFGNAKSPIFPLENAWNIMKGFARKMKRSDKNRSAQTSKTNN